MIREGFRRERHQERPHGAGACRWSVPPYLCIGKTGGVRSVGATEEGCSSRVDGREEGMGDLAGMSSWVDLVAVGPRWGLSRRSRVLLHRHQQTKERKGVQWSGGDSASSPLWRSCCRISQLERNACPRLLPHRLPSTSKQCPAGAEDPSGL